MDWDDVRHFLALARLGSVRAAGGALGVSHSTVLRRVESLEDGLGVRLFDRNRDGYTLTEAGRQMLPGAERIESEMASLERGIVGQDERLEGYVSITCGDPYVAGLLIGQLGKLCAAHPGIELGFIMDGRLFDLSKREADIAVRVLGVGAQPPDHLVGRKVAPLILASYVAIDHAARLDPELPGTSPRWAGFEDRKIMRELIAGSSYPHVPPHGVFASLDLMVRAACEGHGIVMLPTYAGDREPALRRLARPDLRHLADLWLLIHPDLRENARVRAVKQAIARVFEQHAAWFEGGLGSDVHPTVPPADQARGAGRR